MTKSHEHEPVDPLYWKEHPALKGEFTLTEFGFQRLKELKDLITQQLSCDINEEGFPCLGCRIRANNSMMEFLYIHGLVSRKNLDVGIRGES
ncbi:MAG TPA: hypothetical protein VEU72_00565 [Nitrosopumilaceae archaeon]|nr:hypothetical protein [Nitrosopumilaceae archaeon]